MGCGTADSHPQLEAIGSDIEGRTKVRGRKLHKESKSDVGEGIVGRENEDRGFTLVELLVVVVIMGVLSTVSVFAVRGIADRGQQSACDSDKRVLEVAVETWFADESLSTSGTLSEQALVDADLLRSLSELYNVQSDGSVLATEGAACDAA